MSRDRRNLPARVLPAPAPTRARPAPARMGDLIISAGELPAPSKIEQIHHELETLCGFGPIPYRLTEEA